MIWTDTYLPLSLASTYLATRSHARAETHKGNVLLATSARRTFSTVVSPPGSLNSTSVASRT